MEGVCEQGQAIWHADARRELSHATPSDRAPEGRLKGLDAPLYNDQDCFHTLRERG
jgi:hypothetical protein